MSAFVTRDGMLSVIRDGKYRMGPTAHALLWFLLYYGIYDRGSEWYDHVNIKVTSQAELSVAVGRNRQAVRQGLQQLENTGFIKRSVRYDKLGSRLSDDIALTMPKDFCFNCRTRGHAKAECPDPPRENHPTPP